jgi:hypothetical protein
MVGSFLEAFNPVVSPTLVTVELPYPATVVTDVTTSSEIQVDTFTCYLQ